MKNQLDQFCQLDSIVDLINSLNLVPSPTDGEERLVDYITGLVRAENMPVQTITPRQYLRVPPVWVGIPNAKYVLVTHCDRVIKDKNNKVKPLNEPSPPLIFNNTEGTLDGKLDNTVSLAVCLLLMLEIQPKNTTLLITTGEEGRLEPPIYNVGPLQNTGGRGLISYLEDNIRHIKEKYFICVDVRPLDKGDVFIAPNNLMKIGDGLVLRLSEIRANVNLNADPTLLNAIRDCSNNTRTNLVEYRGRGITELGRGWEKVLQPDGYPVQNYHVAWVQPPITQYHTKHEQMSGKDIVDLCKVIKCLIGSFEQN